MILLNPSSKDVYLPEHEIVSTTCGIDETNIHMFDDKKQGFPRYTVLKPYSRDSDKSNPKSTQEINEFYISKTGLSEDQRFELLEFLKRNVDVFSTS